MKGNRIILTALALLLAVSGTHAQVTPSYRAFCDGKTYANGQNDTLPANLINVPTGTNTGYRLASASLMSWYFSATDSVEVVRYLQYRPFGGTSWTTLYTDSTTSLTGTAAAPTVDEDIIRSAVLDKWTYAQGISGYIRAVYVFQATKNGTAGTTTYSAGIHYRP